MPFIAPPETAAWQHHEVRHGFEVVFFERLDNGYHTHGCTTAVEDGQPWTVDYSITVDETWTTRRAEVLTRTTSGARSTVLDADGAGRRHYDYAAPSFEVECRLVYDTSGFVRTYPGLATRVA